MEVPWSVDSILTKHYVIFVDLAHQWVDTEGSQGLN